MNPIFKLLQALPTNGWTTAISGIASVLFGVSGLVLGQLEMEQGVTFIVGGLGILGIGSKIEKMKSAK